MVVIRREKPEDISAIRCVNEQAFDQPAEADLVDALREAGKVVLSLVAKRRDQIVGHILFSPVVIMSEGEQFPALGLAPMAVLPDLQRQGIGSLLVEHGLDTCRKAGHTRVVVLGHPDYYPRFGFVPASRYGLKCQFPAPDDAFMAIELEEGSLQNHAGTVLYQPEFAGI